MIRRRLARASRRDVGGEHLGDGPYSIGLIYCAYCNYIRPRARSSSASAGLIFACLASASVDGHELAAGWAAVAQVHATLAAVAATALGALHIETRAWADVAATKLSGGA